jgi:hypothetical protein
VTIQVRAQFNPLTCGATSAVLGSAGPVTVHGNFAGAPQANTWYHAALANRLSGMDLDGTNPDISATFNVDIDNATCLGTRNWYYGLDGNEGTNIDLLAVVLHELGHGLGFSTTTSGTTGNQLGTAPGLPHIWDHFLRDKSTGLLWKDMTPAQRVASGINTGNLVWDGPAVTLGAPLVLGRQGQMLVNAPGAIAGGYAAGRSSLGPPLTDSGITGDVVLVDDGLAPTGEGCETPFANAAAVAGRIALIDRGTCAFAQKALNAQANGAIAVIIANNVAGTLAPGGTEPTLTIPVVGITQADGNTLKAQLGAGVNVTLRLHPTQLAGTHPDGQVQMYAPNPFQSGSSVSHYDVVATPNLLMEPAINSDLGSGVDLTRDLFVDIGWFTGLLAVGPAGPRGVALAASPNPSRQAFTLRFALEREARVDLVVVDVAGREVARLHRGTLGAGAHAFGWDSRVAPGIYRAVLTVDGETRSQPMVRIE